MGRYHRSVQTERLGDFKTWIFAVRLYQAAGKAPLLENREKWGTHIL